MLIRAVDLILLPLMRLGDEMAKIIKFGNGYHNKQTVADARNGGVGDAAEILMSLSGYAPTDYGPCESPSNASREEAEMALSVIAAQLGYELVKKL